VSHLAIARQAFNERDWLRALAEGEKAVSTGGGADAHSIVGNTFFKMGRFTEAAEEFAKAAKLNPGNRLLEERLRLAQTRAQEKITGEAP
jgi:tetratricopeptide (TPR) repeat protein